MAICKFCGDKGLLWKTEPISGKYYLEDFNHNKHKCDKIGDENRVFIKIPKGTEIEMLVCQSVMDLYKGPYTPLGSTSTPETATYTDTDLLTFQEGHFILKIGKTDYNYSVDKWLLCKVNKNLVELENLNHCLHIVTKRMNVSICPLCDQSI